MLLEEKLFDEYHVNFPLKNKLNIIIGMNGSGKSKLLQILYRQFLKENVNVHYFPDTRYFNVDEDQLMKVLVMNKLISKEDIFSQFNINFNLFDFQSNQGKPIYSGILQLINFFGNILNAGKDAIILIDEIERSLHISIQQEIIKEILKISNVKQLIVVTHSPSIISSYCDNVIEMNSILNINEYLK